MNTRLLNAGEDARYYATEGLAVFLTCNVVGAPSIVANRLIYRVRTVRAHRLCSAFAEDLDPLDAPRRAEGWKRQPLPQAIINKAERQAIARQEVLAADPMSRMMDQANGRFSWTQRSLVGLGLSLSATAHVYELITSDRLSRNEALRWLQHNRELWSHGSLPAKVKREIQGIIEEHAWMGEALPPSVFMPQLATPERDGNK